LLGGSGTITTAGTAAAAYSVGGGICALCVLGDVNTNNTNFTVTGGDIYVDGNVSVNPQSIWTASNSITISGTSNLSQSKATPDWTNGPHIVDPFAGVTLPSSPYAGLNPKSGSPCGSAGPGIYGTVALPNGTCVLQGGAYVITGTWSAKNNTLLTSNGQPVTLFFAGPSGQLDLKNGAIDNMPAPTTTPLPSGFPSTWPTGFVIIYARDNTSPLALQGNGGTTPDLTGNVYALKSTTTFNGNSCFTASGGAVVIGGVSTVGNSCLQVLDAKNAGNALPQNLRLTK
jgi:hypothetical protein